METLRTYLLSSIIFCLLSLVVGRYDVKRLVPSGPDPQQPPATKAYFGLKRLVPSGPDPLEPPATSESTEASLGG